MALVFGDKTYMGTPPVVQNSARRRGNTMRIRKLNIEETTYTAGGVVLTPQHTNLTQVFDAYQLAGVDPEGKQIQGYGIQAMLYLPATGPAKLRLYESNGTEVEDGDLSALTGGYLWIAFIGIS